MTENNDFENNINPEQQIETPETTEIIAESLAEPTETAGEAVAEQAPEITEQLETVATAPEQVAYDAFAETAEMPKTEASFESSEAFDSATGEVVNPGFPTAADVDSEPAPATPWYKKIGSSVGATLGVCACGLLVVGLVAGFSAQAGAKMAASSGHDRGKIEQRDYSDRSDRSDRGYDAYGYDSDDADEYGYGNGRGHNHGYMDDADKYGYGYGDGGTYGYGHGHGYMDDDDAYNGYGYGHGNGCYGMDGSNGMERPDGTEDMPQRGDRGQRGTDEGTGSRGQAPDNSTQTVA